MTSWLLSSIKKIDLEINSARVRILRRTFSKIFTRKSTLSFNHPFQRSFRATDSLQRVPRSCRKINDSQSIGLCPRKWTKIKFRNLTAAEFEGNEVMGCERSGNAARRLLRCSQVRQTAVKLFELLWIVARKIVSDKTIKFHLLLLWHLAFNFSK